MRYLTMFLSALMVVITTSSFAPIPCLVVTSGAFSNNGAIPEKYTCSGQEVSPPITVEHIPAGTKSLAVLIIDKDVKSKADGYYTHWVAWNIRVNDSSITLPEDYRAENVGTNSMHKVGYKGMCPPKGTHHYHIRVYALSGTLVLTNKTTGGALEKAMRGHILAQGETTGWVDRNFK